jgi:peptidoglycan/xylan/chitin deacetylase (PgdA/CDA1 family)
LNLPGTFTISLDFELHWGGFEKWPIDQYRTYFQNTRKVIPEMLALFHQHEVHVTWAAVGMLFYRTKSDLLADAPALKPTYKNSALSAYNYISNPGIGDSEASDPFHFAHSLIEKILQTPNHELGSHSFAHYYCNEDGQVPAQFQADLASAQKAAAHFGKELRSLVFPRNQFNDQYLKVCFDQGITAVRSNPLDWFWNIGSTQAESPWKRFNRGVDAYFPIGRNNLWSMKDIQVRAGLPLCLPASRLLRPYRPKEFFLNAMKINRVKSEMSAAAMSGKVYHLWWHPHNFGNFPAQSMEGLKQIVNHFEYCRKTYNMNSMNMGEIADRIFSNDFEYA